MQDRQPRLRPSEQFTARRNSYAPRVPHGERSQKRSQIRAEYRDPMVVPIRDREAPVAEKRYAYWFVEPPVVAVIVAELSEMLAIAGVEDV